MSRIGKLPIPLPKGVEIKINGSSISVKGPKGTLEREIPERVSVKVENGELIVERDNEQRESRARHGLVRSLLSNMVTGVSEGYKRTLIINGVGYRASTSDKYIRFDLGYSHPIFFELPEGLKAEIVRNVQVVLEGIDKEVVGETAATIRSFRKPEPYKGKGIKYAEEVIVRKVGKAGGK